MQAGYSTWMEHDSDDAGVAIDRAGPSRSTREVLESHLALRREQDLEADLRANYSPAVVVLSAEGINRGHDALRMTARILRGYVPEAGYDYHELLVDGEYGLLTWSARAEDLRIHDGADSFVVRDGRIVMQTIHYSTSPADV